MGSMTRGKIAEVCRGSGTGGGGGGQYCPVIPMAYPVCEGGVQPIETRDNNGCLTGYRCQPIQQGYVPPANCSAWYDGCNNCSRTTANGPAVCTLRACFWNAPGYCTATFSSGKPSISQFSGPQQLRVGETGTWSINASSPDNRQLTYAITWGDEPYAAYSYAAAARESISQQTTFTHTYNTAGAYTVRITVSDGNGNNAETTSTVVVNGSQTVCAALYDPVCAQPPHVCPPGLYCTMMMPAPRTYSNQCLADADGATTLYRGACYGY